MSALVVAASLVEVAGMGAVMQFMKMVGTTGPAAEKLLALVGDWIGLQSSRDLMLAVGIGTIAFLTFGKLLNALALWYRHRYVWELDKIMAIRLMRGFLSRPYSWYLNQNSAFLNRYLGSNEIAHNVLFPVTDLFASVVLATAILVTLFWVDPGVALVATLGVGTLGGLLVVLTRRPILRWAHEGHKLMDRRSVVGYEAVAGFKPIQSAACESYYLKEFSYLAGRGSQLKAWAGMTWDLPRYLLEAVGLGSILALTLYYVIWAGAEHLLPMLSLYAMAGHRLIPTVHSAYLATSKIRIHLPHLEAYIAFVEEPPNHPLEAPTERLRLRQSLRLNEVHFSYRADLPVLRGIRLEIAAGENIGIVGSTGAGKSTLIDILMGLLLPTSGEFQIDGKSLDETSLRSWRSSVGYVPQQVFLKDDTLLRNVGFGISDDEIDANTVNEALKAAGLKEFVDELPEGLQTYVGDNGVRLSGGQRQRLGIARALYHDPDVLIFDEATSSLDGVTERNVLEAIETLSGGRTMITVAHRLQTVKPCDRILVLERGKLVNSGTFDELLESSAEFRALAEAQESTQSLTEPIRS